MTSSSRPPSVRSPTKDAWRGLTALLEETLALCARNRGLKVVFETRRGRCAAERMRRRIRPVFAELVTRAREQGSLREDFMAEDVPLVLWSTDRVMDLAAVVAPDLWRRQLGFVLDGLRASAASPLARAPLSGAELRRVEGSAPASAGAANRS